MKKIVIPAILTATVLIAGMFAFMPVEKASTVHTTITGTIDDLVTTDSIVAADGITAAGDGSVVITGAGPGMIVLTCSDIDDGTDGDMDIIVDGADTGFNAEDEVDPGTLVFAGTELSLDDSDDTTEDMTADCVAAVIADTG